MIWREEGNAGTYVLIVHAASKPSTMPVSVPWETTHVAKVGAHAAHGVTLVNAGIKLASSYGVGQDRVGLSHLQYKRE